LLIISDKLHVRAPFFVGAISLLIPIYLSFTFVQSFVLVAIPAGIAGFSIMGVSPVWFQHDQLPSVKSFKNTLSDLKDTTAPTASAVSCCF